MTSWTIRLSAVAAGALLLLAGCTTLLPGPEAPAPAAVAPADYLEDGTADIILAVNLPSGVVPIPEESRLTFSVGAPERGGDSATASLVPADGDLVRDVLPPPGKGRADYLLGLGEADRRAVHDVQAAGRRLLAEGIEPAVSLEVVPRFCATGSLNLSGQSFSVSAILPGRPLPLPLIPASGLTAALPPGSTALPPCR